MTREEFCKRQVWTRLYITVNKGCDAEILGYAYKKISENFLPARPLRSIRHQRTNY